MGSVIMPETLEQHDENDSTNGRVIALRVGVYCKEPKPTRPADWWLDFRICREVLSETREVWGDGFKPLELAAAANRRLRLGLDRRGIASLAESMRNVFRSRIMDSFTIAVINSINDKPTLPPMWFYKAPEARPKQMKLVFGGTEITV